MDTLPQDLLDIINRNCERNARLSWQISGWTNTTVVSLKFEGSHHGGISKPLQHTYRRKPTSTVVRDRARQADWYNRQEGLCDMNLQYDNDIMLEKSLAVCDSAVQVNCGFETQNLQVNCDNETLSKDKESQSIIWHDPAKETFLTTMSIDINPVLKPVTVHDIKSVDSGICQSHVITSTPLKPGILSKDETVIKHSAVWEEDAQINHADQQSVQASEDIMSSSAVGSFDMAEGFVNNNQEVYVNNSHQDSVVLGGLGYE